MLLADGVRVRRISVIDGEVSIWAAFSKTGPVLKNDQLLRATNLGAKDEAYLARKLNEFAQRAEG